MEYQLVHNEDEQDVKIEKDKDFEINLVESMGSDNDVEEMNLMNIGEEDFIKLEDENDMEIDYISSNINESEIKIEVH